ncbi:MAG: FAD-binding oxidoreductase [Gammaproteobacteria bacterium]|nr:FAD-binding oxidoreductase [Gammaproteobacteria bacterium]MCP5013633.1 FAD-binding oxidoreductase [Aestuariibacter sp.]
MKDVIVIGGGIIGLCAAEKLVSQGHEVTIIEKDRIAAGASYGNAAGFAFSEVMPMASYTTILQSLRWIMDPAGPFSIIPQDLPYTLNWLIRFALASRKSTFEQSLRVQAKLMQLGKTTLPQMLERTNLDKMVNTTGALYLYDTKSQYLAAQKSWRLRQKYDVEYECYQGSELHRYQPGLANNIFGGIHSPNFQLVSNPNDFCLAIHKHIQPNAVATIYHNVVGLTPKEGRVEVALQGADSLMADKVIIAAGPWSGELSRALGDNVPLTGERGYNTTLPKSALPDLTRTIFFAPHGFVIAPLADGVRVGGASEIARLDRPANYKRSDALLRKAKALVPELQLTDGEQWMGIRPTTPDTLPVIGTASRHPNVIYAFGHGHLGLTQATATAQLIYEIVSGQKRSIDPDSLSASRF